MEYSSRLAAQSQSDHGHQEEIESLRRERDTALRQVEEYQDLLRQSKADFAEYRRKVEAEREEQAAQIRVELLLRVLPVLDALQQALAVPREQRVNEAWIASIEQIERDLRAVLEAEGVRRIDAVGAYFNPWLHEALQHQTSPELEDERILAVVREGYRLGDRVIRPAQVVVGRRSR